jgi:hypothetical protein
VFPIARITIKNSGQIDALNLKASIGRGFLKGRERDRIKNGRLPASELCGDIPILEVKDRGRYFESQAESTPYDNWEDSEIRTLTIKGEYTFYVWGEISYDDVLGNEYIFQYCAFAKDITSTQLTFCANANKERIK